MKKVFGISILLLGGATLISGCCLAKKMDLFKTDDSADYAKFNTAN